MIEKIFQALEIKEISPNCYERSIVSRHITDLPKGDLLIKVHYSSLNYKDALSATGNRGVTKNYPHTPGIDAAGIVVESTNQDFSVGDEVIVTGYDLGMNTSGGFSEYIRIPSHWAIQLPTGFSLRESMIYGTAGFTAALSVNELIKANITPEDGEILVTGATGGVGSIVTAILYQLGYTVIAATGRMNEKSSLQALGATDIIHRNDLDDQSGRALGSGRWAGVIDTVGGNMLATAIKSTKYGACVTCCGNIAADTFTTSVYPFILRGVRLIGIDSGRCPTPTRNNIWAHIATDWKASTLLPLVQELSLDEVSGQIDAILAGTHKGRSIIKL